jgi:hypothetical protein
MKRHAALLAVLALGALAHGAVLLRFPVVRTWGDEASYTREAHRRIDLGAANLLPGQMIFHHRPPLGFSWLAVFAERDLVRHPEAEKWIIDNPNRIWSDAMARFLARVSRANLALLLATAVAVYAIALRIGAGRGPAVLGAAIVVLHPRLGFFVQSLWPEVLHAALLVGGLGLVAHALEDGPRGLRLRAFGSLALAGILLGYAALARGVVGPFVWIAAALAAFVGARSLGGIGRWRSAFAGLAAGAALLAAFELTLLPQRLRNLAEHGTARIAHNTWRNIEGGLLHGPEQQERYWAGSDDPVEREAAARARVFAYLAQTSWSDLALRQTGALVEKIDRSYVAQGLRLGRWRGVAPRSVEARLVASATRLASWSLLATGLLGLAIAGHASPGALLFSLFSVYYLAGLFVVIPNPRMFVQLVPVLALLTALLAGRLRLRTSPVRSRRA